MLCQCGCGIEPPLSTRKGRTRRFVQGHKTKKPNICTKCGIALNEFNWSEYVKPWKRCKTCHKNDENAYQLKHRVKIRAKQRQKTKELRLKVLAAYGGKCSCCGEKNVEFLAIDHINGDGKKDRLLYKPGRNWWLAIIRQNYPTHIRILCHNCNMSRGFYGYCPHEKENCT